MTMSAPSFRPLLGPGRLLELIGCQDALSARLVAAAGFQGAYVSGYALAAALGFADNGCLSFSEVRDQLRFVARSVDVPVLADADDGYGGPDNVARTVVEFEQVGIAGLHLEDQAFPKRPASQPDKTLISSREMCDKVRRAVRARRSPEFLIVARTDALAPLGLEEAVTRARAYAQAGADLVMVHAIPDVATVEAVARAVRAPLATTAGHWRDRLWDREALRSLGYQMVLYSSPLVRAATRAMREALETFRATGTWASVWNVLEAPERLDALVR